MKYKMICLISAFILILGMSASVQAMEVCLESDGGITFEMEYNPSTGNLIGDYNSGSGPAFGTLNRSGLGFTLVWLSVSGCSGIYQGVWTGNGSSAYFENDCGSTGTRTISFCGRGIENIAADDMP